jgi:5-(hydroxymethyl)furfural/furfural oxidase
VDGAVLDEWLRATVSDYVHACGTCKMGSPEGLSVVDASIVPIIPRANTHLTAVMIAERAVAFLTG